MKRRNFIKNILPLTAAPFALNGVPIRAMSQGLMLQSFDCDQINDRAVVIVQLHGGNDGLNTIIPVDQYDLYRNYRPIIGVPDTGSRKYLDLIENEVGLHPDLVGVKAMYDQGMANIIQDVSYPNTNGSHFRGTDVWLSGKTGESIGESAESGWFGRYLDHKFPNYPDQYPSIDMPDPPGLEFGSHIVSLGFHRAMGIPMGLTISNNPTTFLQQVASVGGLLPEDIPISEHGDELKFITEVQKSTDVYAERLASVYEQGTNMVTYPETYHTNASDNYNNRLAGQLKTVARLISGGCKTKFYLVRIGGFDTHANQGIPDKPSFGGHGALLYHLGQSIKTFHDDLEAMGLGEKVLTVTFSEFGRQVRENGDWGTDHGTSAPMMIFGKGVKGGVTGSNPNLSNIRNNRLQGFQHDYRQVLATILQDWLGANNGTVNESELLEFTNQKLDLINDNYIDGSGNSISFVADLECDETPDPPAVSIDPELELDFKVDMFPNPTTDFLNLRINSDRLLPARIQFYSLGGRLMKEKTANLMGGEQLVQLNLTDLAKGMYIVRVIVNAGSVFKVQMLSSQKIVVK